MKFKHFDSDDQIFLKTAPDTLGFMFFLVIPKKHTYFNQHMIVGAAVDRDNLTVTDEMVLVDIADIEGLPE